MVADNDNLIVPWDIVLCTNADFPKEVRQTAFAIPEEGEVYVVRTTLNHGTLRGEPVIGLILFELINPPILMHDYNGVPFVSETTFSAKRFVRIGHYSEIVNLFINFPNFDSFFTNG